MGGIINYEIRRLIFNKAAICLFIINVLYAVIILNTETILGAGYTAPFSGWSLGGYWAMTLPAAMVTILFMLTRFFSSSAKSVDVLISASPVNQELYKTARLAAVSFGFVIIVLTLFLLAAVFTMVVFNELPLTELFLTMLLTAFPCYLVILGIGSLLGKIHSGLLYSIMIIIILVGFFPLNNIYDFFGGGYFLNEPLKLPAGADGEPPFTLSLNFIFMRIIYFITGVAVLIFYIHERGNKFISLSREK